MFGRDLKKKSASEQVLRRSNDMKFLSSFSFFDTEMPVSSRVRTCNAVLQTIFLYANRTILAVCFERVWRTAEVRQHERLAASAAGYVQSRPGLVVSEAFSHQPPPPEQHTLSAPSRNEKIFR